MSFPLGRRGVLAGAASAAAALPAGATPAAAQSAEFRTAEYAAARGEARLVLYRKRLHAPATGAAALPVLFLAHGSSVSALPSFDLVVPGLGEYSMMNVFARLGYDVWTMDFEGYGRSTMPTGNSDIATGALDLAAAADVIARETGEQKFHVMGESSGALRAGVYAMAHPERVRRLVLEAFTWTGDGSPTLTKRAEQAEYYKTHTRRPRGRDMISSIFTRDHPGMADQRVAEAMADAEMVHGDSIPAGTYLDMTVNLPVIDPTKITVPTLVARGEFDGIATEPDLLAFFQKLATQDRQLSIIPGAAHSISLGYARAKYWHVMHAFLSMPDTEVG